MTPRNLPAIGYLRVSTREQGDSGHGLAAQETAIREACERRGWRLETIHQDVISTRRKQREGLRTAMEQARAAGGVLVAAKMSRLARSTRELLALHEQAGAEGWHIVTLDLDMDTTTPHGKAFFGMLAVFAEFERDLISERTKDALAAAKKRGTKSGKPIGRPRTLPKETLDQLQALRRSGLSLERTAAELNRLGIKGSQGGNWHKRSVARAERMYR